MDPGPPWRWAGGFYCGSPVHLEVLAIVVDRASRGRVALRGAGLSRRVESVQLSTDFQPGGLRRPPRPTLAALMCAGAMALATGTSAQVPSPSIEGPITNPGTPFVAATTFDLAQVGYEEAEYFISGTAR